MNNELYSEINRTTQLAPQGGTQLQQATKKAFDEAKYALNPFRSDPKAPPTQVEPSTPAGSPPVGLGYRRPPLQSAQAPGSPVTDQLTTPNFGQVAPKTTAPVNPVTQIGNGMSLSHDREGNRIYTAGVKDQPGYGYMKVMPGSSQNAGQAQAGVALAGQLPEKGLGYSLRGNQGAKEAFMRPAQQSGQQYTDRMVGPASPDYGFLKPDSERNAGGAPKYLGKESGLGWKTRLGLYKEQMDTFNKETGNRNALDVEAMREAGAGGRALLAAKGINDRNAIDAQQVQVQRDQLAAGAPMRQAELEEKQVGLGYSKQVRAMRDKLMASTDPNEQKNLMRQLYAIQGKPDQQKYQIANREEPVDPNNPMRGMKKIPYAIDMGTRETFEVGANGGLGYPYQGGYRVKQKVD